MDHVERLNGEPYKRGAGEEFWTLELRDVGPDGDVYWIYDQFCDDVEIHGRSRDPDQGHYAMCFGDRIYNMVRDTRPGVTLCLFYRRVQIASNL